LRLLLDSCVSGSLKQPLETATHDVIWVGDWSRDPGDEEILASAHADQRVLITLDKDFGELAIVHGRPHSGIVRLSDIALRNQFEVLMRILSAHGDDLNNGAVVTAESGRLLLRPKDEE
jgi:predicted nuclease of predicted toxin-antitoxin system